MELGRHKVLSLVGRTPGYNVSYEAADVEMTYDGAHKLRATLSLHGAGEPATARMGAATVQRVLRRHKGSIWTPKDEVGRGVLFYAIPCPKLPLNPVAPRRGG